MNALVVGGLLGTAGVLWRAVIKLAELGIEMKSQDKRLGRLEDRRNRRGESET